MRVPLAVISVACFAFCASVRAEVPATQPLGVGLPRYHLSPGQELTYVAAGEFKYQHGTLKNESKNVYDVVGANADGGWHIIGRLTSSETQNDSPAQPETELIAFDLHPDGAAALSPGVTARGGIPIGDFPALPADQSQSNDGWKRERSFGAHFTFNLLPATRPTVVEFTGVQSDPIDRIYDIKFQTTYQFDTARGLVTSSTVHNSQGYGFVGKGEFASTLKGDEPKAAKWIDQLAHDCDAYFSANAKSVELREKASEKGSDFDAQYAAAKEVLTAARKQIASPEIIDLCDKQIAVLPDMEKSDKEDAARLQAVLNKPAPEWSLFDQAGKRHMLGDYRGKVVVLDFWYRGCGWCMRAMPEMKNLAVEFAGKPVAVLGMNTDSNPDDPKFVVDAFALDYPILHAHPKIVDQYRVEGFPTVIVIGPDGMVKDMEIGYSPKLHDQLAAKITELMPTK